MAQYWHNNGWIRVRTKEMPQNLEDILLFDIFLHHYESGKLFLYPISRGKGWEFGGIRPGV